MSNFPAPSPMRGLAGGGDDPPQQRAVSNAGAANSADSASSMAESSASPESDSRRVASPASVAAVAESGSARGGQADTGAARSSPVASSAAEASLGEGDMNLFANAASGAEPAADAISDPAANSADGSNAAALPPAASAAAVAIFRTGNAGTGRLDNGAINLALLGNEPSRYGNPQSTQAAAATMASSTAACSLESGSCRHDNGATMNGVARRPLTNGGPKRGLSMDPRRGGVSVPGNGSMLSSSTAGGTSASASQGTNGSSENVLVYEVPSMARRHFLCLNDMRKQQTLCDVTLCVGPDTAIPAHRSVLASASPYFYAMFTGEMTEATQASIQIHGVDPKAMQLLVEFAYTSIIEVQEDNVQQLLPAASLLQLESVVSACCQFLEAVLHPSNCLGVKQFADLHSCSELYKAAENFSKHRFTEVCRFEEFLELSVDDVVELMSADDLGVKSEEQVFEAALTWLHYGGDGDESDLGPSGSSRKACIGKVMSAVRLPMCTKHFLVRCADRDEMLRSSDEYKDLLIEALKYQLISPNERQELIKSLPDNLRIRDRHRGSLPHVLMVIGGQAPKAVRSVEKCDLGTVKWSNAADLNSRRCRCGVAVVNDTVYAIGGFDGSSRVRTVEAYDIRSDSWQIIASMNVRRSTLGAAMLGGLIYAVGGFDGSVGLDTVERYNASKNEWTLVASMSVRRSSVGVAAMGGYLYALGGYDGVTRHCLSSVECFDKDTDKWRSVADMNQTRSGAAVAVVGDLLYAIGGHDGPEIRKSVEVYEPVSDTWTLCAPMICARRNAGAVAVDGMIYVVGGDDGSCNLSSVEMFDPTANAWYMLSGSLQIGRSYAAITAIERPVDDQCQTRQMAGSEHEVIRWK